MSLFHTMNSIELLDSPLVNGETVKRALVALGAEESCVTVKTVS